MEARDGEATMGRPLRREGFRVVEDTPAIDLRVKDIVGAPEDDMVFLGVWIQRYRDSDATLPSPH